MFARISRLYAFVLLLLTLHASASPVRRFAAAPKAPHLRRRDLSFEPHHGKHVLLFEDETSTDSAARIHLAPKYPILVLEDVSDHIKGVACSSSEMIIHFHAAEAMNAAVDAWSKAAEFVFISMHESCAEQGTHEPYLVKYKSAHGESRSIVLCAEKKTFKDTVHRISVDLGTHVMNDLQPKVKRQIASSTTLVPSATSSNVQIASLPATNVFNFSAPTGTPSTSKATKEVSFQAKNKSILPPDESIVALFPGTEPLGSTYLGCKECSMSGCLTLEAAGFDVDSSQLDQIMDFFDDGYFQFTANNLKARMLLEFGLLPGFTPVEFVANLTRIPLTPIAIPKLLTLGPAIELTVPLGITLNSPANFTTGFELVVPDNSKIILNVSEISGSSQSGFDQTTFKQLPFTTTADNLNFNLTVGLRPRLVVSAGVGSTSLPLDAEGGVGAFIDLPRLVANIATVQNVNDKCDGPAAGSISNRAIRIISNAIFNLGLHWELGLKLGAIEQVRGGEQILATKSVSLPSQCLISDNKSGPRVPNMSSTSRRSGHRSGVRFIESSKSTRLGVATHMTVLLVIAVVFCIVD